MDNRERMRLFMAHLRAARVAKGLCYRCGGPREDEHKACRICRLKRSETRGKMALTGIAEPPSTRVA